VGSGTNACVPKATLSTSSPGNAARLETFTRPMSSGLPVTPKNVPATGAAIVKLPSERFDGLKTEINTLPAANPGNTSNPTAFTATLNVRFSVSPNVFGPSNWEVLPSGGNPAPKTATSPAVPGTPS